MLRPLIVSALLAASLTPAAAQDAPAFTRADTLRGSFTTHGRVWWDVTFYDLHVSIDPADSSIEGSSGISYRVLQPGREMQIDLFEPLVIDSMVQDGRSVEFTREGNAFFVTFDEALSAGARETITVYFRGRPHVAARPPWDGGFTWATDSLGRPWVVTTGQGIGASIWWPNKDTQADEPDSQRVAITVPDPMINVSNGRLRSRTSNPDGTTTYEYFVVNPINNYLVTVNAASYGHFSDVYQGEKGELTLEYWPLDYNLEAAKRQFTQAISTLKCFEHWFGPYPWYEDGFQLVEVPHNGMEHQSAIAYGNPYSNGYQGVDQSGTGLGLEWDFIIVHEAAHEWWGNNITTKDIADMWVHESFGNYSENLYTECLFGKEAGARYVIGTRRGIRNNRPIIPPYNVNMTGSGDMYPKGGNMLHTIRQIVNDDEKWRGVLRGLNETFWHQTVMGWQIEEYIIEHAGVDLTKVFDQYLRTITIPELEYRIDGNTLHYRWSNVVTGFDMQVGVTLSDSGFTVIHPTEEWQTLELELSDPNEFEVDANYYVTARDVSAAESGGP
jgi:aminopeptidase N